MGWVIGSREAATYVHLSGRDTDDKIKELYGLKTEENKEIVNFKPIDCPRCHIINDAASKFCNGCGLGLDEKSIIEYDKQKEKAIEIGFGLTQSRNDTQDKINQVLLDKVEELRKKLEELENKK